MKVGKTIYFDHQATTPVDRRVFEAMKPYFYECFGNPHSMDHVLGWDSARAVEVAATKLASMIGADADEVIFTSGATEANNLALLGLACSALGRERQKVLVSSIEHKSILSLARVLRARFGFEVGLIPVDQNGIIVLSELEQMIDENVLLTSIMLVNNEIGSIQPIHEIKHICDRFGVLLHCDGAQSPCAIDVHGIAANVDLLSLSAHKMYGPKGLGALFVNRSLQSQIEPIIYGGGQQGQIRSGTIPTPLCVGMGVAAELMVGTPAALERERLRGVRDRFVSNLRQLNFPIQLNGPSLTDRHPGNVNVRFKGCSAHEILGLVQPNLAASTGSACTSGIPEPSHVLTAIGLTETEAEESVRFSLGRHTTEADVDEAAQLLSSALSRALNSP